MYDSSNVYQKLIFAALARLECEGVLPAFPDEVARLAGVSPETVLGLFRSADALRDGLIYQGVVLLNDALREGILTSGSTSPDIQLRHFAHSYGEWAERNPALFRLLVDGLERPLPEDSTLYRFTVSIRELVSRKLTEMRRIGLLRQETDIAPIMLVVHCVMRGNDAVLAGRPQDPWLRNDPRPTAGITSEIFDFFIDNLLAVNAPRAA